MRLSFIPPLCLLLSACHHAAPPDPGGMVEAVPIDDPRYQLLWESAKDVLRQHRFTLDRTDRREGIITTFPAGSAHFFEFWRKDVATRDDWWEATVCPIRRSAIVTFDRTGDGQRRRLDVVVRKQRLAAPQRQINNSAAALRFFSDSLPTIQSAKMISRDETVEWVDLGRDPAMERRITESILTGPLPR